MVFLVVFTVGRRKWRHLLVRPRQRRLCLPASVVASSSSSIHFQSCGTVNRVTIRSNKFRQPKGYACVEFVEPEAVQEALLLDESELHGRRLKGYRSRVPYMPTQFFSPYGYGKVPRLRMPMRYSPYY